MIGCRATFHRPGAAAFLAVAMVAVALLAALIWLSNEVIAIVGGLFVYGAPGLIVGPAALAVTLALLDILRRRTAHGKPAELPT